MPKPEEYKERKSEIAGWPVTIVTYRLESTYYTTVENADPGAWVVKAQGSSCQEAEGQALKEAETLLSNLKKRPPSTGCLSVPGF